MNKGIKILLLLFLVIFQSCKTMKTEKDNMLFIMVYDFESKEINDVEIYINDEKIGKTDIYGRYILQKKNNYKNIVFKKKSYEEIKIDINEKKEEFLYIKMGSAKYYAQMSEQLYDKNEFENAQKYIQKALQIEDRKDYRYLESLINKEMLNEKSI